MSLTPIRHAMVATAAIAALTLSGCTGSTDVAPEGTAASTDAGDALSGELTVFAAASLSGAFDELAEQFEHQHPDLEVLPISYDGSSVLATQLLAGAPADVFAAADVPTMTEVVDAGLASDPRIFATNILEIVVAAGNPLKIEDLEDLTAAELVVILCVPEAPCGTASRTILDDADITLTPASAEQNVTAVLAKVKSGEADAGLVYATDVSAAGSAVTGVKIDGADKATNEYPLAALNAAANPDAAETFVDFVLSDAGQSVLAEFGFGAP